MKKNSRGRKFVVSVGIPCACIVAISVVYFQYGGKAESKTDAAYQTERVAQQGASVVALAKKRPKNRGSVSPSSSGFTPLLAYDMDNARKGARFLNWTRSVYDDTHAVSHGISVKITTAPGPDPLPACSGSHFYAGRTPLDKNMRVPEGKTLWYRVMMYIPKTFSFGYKYSPRERSEAKACRQHQDGNYWLKWMVVSPSNGTGRVYLHVSEAKRALEAAESQVRLHTETTQKFNDVDMRLPRDRWFALQLAVKVSSESDGFIRGWIDDEFIGEVKGKTFSKGNSIYDWGIGDYWNGVPWTDGRPGRTDFWVDEIILATDMDGYDAPTGLDAGGRAYIPAGLRVSDLVP